MATNTEILELKELKIFFSNLIKKLELQGKSVKNEIRSDITLRGKYDRFTDLSKKKKQRDKELKENKPKQAPLSQPPPSRKERKRRYAQFAKYDQSKICASNPRKKMKRNNVSFRNHSGYSPSIISYNNKSKKPKPKQIENENDENNENKQMVDNNKENAQRPPSKQHTNIHRLSPFGGNSHHKPLKLLNYKTPSTKRGILTASNRSSLKNRMQKIIKTEDSIQQSTDDHKIKECEKENLQTPKPNITKTKTQSNEPIYAHTVKISQKTMKKSTQSKKKRTTSKKRKTKKDGASVSKNFVKIDMKHKTSSVRRAKKSKKKPQKKYDKNGELKKTTTYFQELEQKRRDQIKATNFDLENPQMMKAEVYSSDDDIAMVEACINAENESKKNNQKTNNEYFDRLNDCNMDDLMVEILQKEYGYDSYRNGQKEAIKQILNKKSTLLLLSTGAGKSLCYQIPTILWKNHDLKPLTLVISPLISLMQDQCDNLPKCLNGKVWNSSLSSNEVYNLRQDVVNADVNILFVSPEKLDNNYFRSFLKNSIGSQRLMFACIDEAHCISEWSHNFRPSYLKLKSILMDYLQIGCILACTATATVITQKSIIKNLHIDRENVVNCLQSRDNLHLTVSHIGNGVNKQEKLLKLLRTQRFANPKSLIIYATTRNEVDEVASKVKMRLKRDNRKLEIEAYHAGNFLHFSYLFSYFDEKNDHVTTKTGKSNEERAEIQNKFMDGSVHVIVATIAFGMGLNKTDVRGVIHYSMPKTMEHYVQEVGRAGRDGLGSECHVFYDCTDITRARSWIYKNGLDLTQIKRILFDIFSSKNVKSLRSYSKRNKEKRIEIKKQSRGRKKKSRSKDIDFSDDEQVSDCDDDELILKDFKDIGHIVAISKDVGIERKYDAKSVVLGTIFTYFDVYKSDYLQQLPSHHDKMRIGITKNEKELEKDSEIIRFITHCYKKTNGYYSVRLGKLYNDLRNIHIDDGNGNIIDISREYTTFALQKHLKNLQWQRKITLDFDDQCFVLRIQKKIENHGELLELCQNVFDYVSQHEKSELEKINTLAQALRIIANQNQNTLQLVDDDGSEINEKKISLHELVDAYFKCESHDEFMDLVQSYLPSHEHLRTVPVSKDNLLYKEVKQSMQTFMTENPGIKRVRSIAKIFHGFDSPLFPAKAWWNSPYWRKHANFPFMQMMQIGKDIHTEKRKKQKQIKKNDKPITDPSKIENPLVLNAMNLNDDYTPFDDENDSDLRAVCVAKFLSDRLRPHQREGIQFMYECIMGIKNGKCQSGMILADEMGLGKTLQTIVLIYTLLNDGPFDAECIDKAVIVTPSSLVGNWKKEFSKWISTNRRQKCNVVAMDTSNKIERDGMMDSFCNADSSVNVLIISYEMIRNYVDFLSAEDTNIGLIVCDEGHRLKNSGGNQTIDALQSIHCKKRILLTGTPVQNNLSELYAMCDYVNPNCLGDLASFRNIYSKPIELSRDVNCDDLEKEIGAERSKELNKITSAFIMRRTAEQILKKYLKPKDEYIIFHRLSPLQIALYETILSNKSVQSIVSSKNVSQALQCIMFMRMCCSSPRLAYDKMVNSKFANFSISEDIQQEIMNVSNNEILSEKMRILDSLLRATKKSGDKIVIVANFTSILDEVESILNMRNYKFLRLDGSTSSTKRTKLVSRFNSEQNKQYFVFLLSSKAGGCGLNLVGANRLVLLEPDWNPATDAQAMARIWRDGQKKKCKIYRFITAGTIEEKIFQRQMSKLEVADSVVNSDSNGKSGNFSKEHLKEIFELNTEIENCQSMQMMAKSMSDWTMNVDVEFIQNVIPIEDAKQIPVIFERSVNPQTDAISRTDLLVQKEQVIINKEVKEDEDGNDSDNDEVMESSDEYIPESDDDY